MPFLRVCLGTCADPGREVETIATPQPLQMFTRSLHTTLVLFAFCATAGVQADAPTPQGSRQPAAAESAQPLLPHQQAVWVRAQVAQIDLGTRTLWLETASGPIELQASETMQRLDRVREGDWLDVQYELALAVGLAPATGIRERVTTESSARAPGGAPAGAGHIEETLRVDVLEVNTANSSLRVRGARGRIGWIKVMDDQVMAQAKVGEQIVIRYRLAMMLAFQPL